MTGVVDTGGAGQVLGNHDLGRIQPVHHVVQHLTSYQYGACNRASDPSTKFPPSHLRPSANPLPHRSVDSADLHEPPSLGQVGLAVALLGIHATNGAR